MGIEQGEGGMACKDTTPDRQFSCFQSSVQSLKSDPFLSAVFFPSLSPCLAYTGSADRLVKENVRVNYFFMKFWKVNGGWGD